MNKTAHILVIEDDPDGLRSICEVVADAGYTVVAATTGKEGVEQFQAEAPDVVLTDLILPDIDGVAVLEKIRQLDAHVPVLLMTAYGSVDTAVRALKSGAYDYLVKPLDLEDVQIRLARAVETSRLRIEVSVLQREIGERFSTRSMVAASPAMQGVLRRIAAVAPTQATVLILGESGTGKELVAHALHAEGRRSGGPFVVMNCGAFTESLLESELFGHEKGSFTGAITRHSGAFERAHGGTLFLDEIGIAPRSVQARLLRAIEHREILRVGGTDPLKVDVRIISASNRDLRELVQAGVFLPDLLYRLQVVTILLPPLRERPEDIRPLAERFIAQAAREHGRELKSIAPDYFERLAAHPWPGNIRELRNVVESSVIMATGPVLSRNDLALDAGSLAAPERIPSGLHVPAGMSLVAIEKEVLRQTLARSRGNRSMTAEALGISVRTVLRKIKEYGLD